MYPACRRWKLNIHGSNGNCSKTTAERWRKRECRAKPDLLGFSCYRSGAHHVVVFPWSAWPQILIRRSCCIIHRGSGASAARVRAKESARGDGRSTTTVHVQEYSIVEIKYRRRTRRRAGTRTLADGEPVFSRSCSRYVTRYSERRRKRQTTKSSNNDILEYEYCYKML